ncbi:hypothetical protein QE379_001748 [Sphingomonas sp. SORGH_AS 879]|nr:hypothetical protein [Sphingomonas sp. SORGH_AS_0879]
MPNIQRSSGSAIIFETRAISASTAFDTKRRSATGGRLLISEGAAAKAGAAASAAPPAISSRRLGLTWASPAPDR